MVVCLLFVDVGWEILKIAAMAPIVILRPKGQEVPPPPIGGAAFCGGRRSASFFT